MTSPTYTIVSEYEGTLPLHHIDLYRIADEEEFVQLGIDDLLYGDGVSIVEWPERAGSELAGAVTVSIEIGTNGERLISGPDSLLAPENDDESPRD